jgi:hypothetical protein
MSEKVLKACVYCAPLFFINALAVGGMADLPKPDAVNGTATLIRFENKTYAVTAHHVVKLLRKKAAEVHRDAWLFTTLLGGRGDSLVDRYLPSFPDWFEQPSAQYPENPPDIALSRINERFLETIGKAAFSFERDADDRATVAHTIGCPRCEKFDTVHERGRRMVMNCVRAVAERASAVRFYSELQERPTVSSLNGMSGGPVFCTRGDEIDLMGIAVEGLDFEPGNLQTSDPAAGLSESHRVTFGIQPITGALLRSWIAELGESLERGPQSK